MKKILRVIPLALLLTACGKQAKTPVTPFTPEVVNCFDVGGVYVNASGWYPECLLNEDVWDNLQPMYAFCNDDLAYVYLGQKRCDGYASSDLAGYICSSTDSEALQSFIDSYVVREPEHVYRVITAPTAHLPIAVQEQRSRQGVDGYDNEDIIMYSLCTTADGINIAVCEQDLGHTVQYIYLKSAEVECSLRDEGMTLLIQDTGECIPLTWNMNVGYLPTITKNPEILP